MNNDNKNDVNAASKDAGPAAPRRVSNKFIMICIAIAIVAGLAGAIFTRPRGASIVGGISQDALMAGNINIRLTNSIVNITTHDSDAISVVHHPPATGRAAEIAYEYDPATSTLYIIENRRWFFFSFGGGRLVVYLPQGRRLGTVSANTTNGAVSANGIRADVAELTATNGAVAFENVIGGNFTARTTDGAVRGSNITAEGDLYLRTTNGAIALADANVGRNLTARTTNGGINVNHVQADRANMTLRTTNGRVYLDGARQ